MQRAPRSYGKAESALIKASGVPELPFTDFSSAVASGFGFGLLMALVSFGNVLAAYVSVLSALILIG